MIKYLICGGGISGLYTALLLLDKGLAKGSEIKIVEKSWRLGGRINTIEKDSLKYEAGAGRFPDSHKLLLALIERYNLKDKIWRLSDKKHCRIVLEDSIILPNMEEVDQLMDKLVKLELDNSMRFKTLAQLCNELFGLEQTQLLITSFGYDDEFYTRNAYDGLAAMKTDFRPEFHYNVLIGGLYQIIEGIKRELEKVGVSITLNLKLVDWNGKNAEFVDFNGKKSKIEYEKLILALDKSALKQLPKLICHTENLLDSVEPGPLMRIYAKFPVNKETGFAWFHGLYKTTTNLPIRMFIPINEEAGLCMISYSDRTTASEWQDLAILGDLEHFVMKYIRQMYPERTIPEPEWIEHYFWHNGCYYWIPYVDSEHNYSKIIQPFQNIFICGESYSNVQGWIEGALKTATDVVGRIANNTTREDREYTMEEVASSNNLTVIDGNVYNLFKMDWLDRHPGGPVIKKAVGKDATPMFKYINHPKYAKDILEELYVGKLK